MITAHTLATAPTFGDVAGLRRAYAELRAAVIVDLGLTGHRVRFAAGSFQLWCKIEDLWVRWCDGPQDDMRDIVSLRPGREWRLTSRVAVPASVC